MNTTDELRDAIAQIVWNRFNGGNYYKNTQCVELNGFVGTFQVTGKTWR